MTKLPNILITGTPGTGKTQTASLAAERIKELKHLNVGNLVAEHCCHEGKDEEFDSYILDEEKLMDVLEPMLSEGGLIVDYHSPEIFSADNFDLVLVLRASTDVLYDRLVERRYNEKKRSENMECEIMQVVLEEVREVFDLDMIYELQNDTTDHLDANVGRIEQWFSAWKTNNV